MKDLVLHLGMPKTDSSALQVFLARNHDALLQRGVDYLPIGEFPLGVQGRISAGMEHHILPQRLVAEIEEHFRDENQAMAENYFKR